MSDLMRARPPELFYIQNRAPGVFPEFTTGCLSKLETASAKAFMVEQWQKWKGLAV